MRIVLFRSDPAASGAQLHNEVVRRRVIVHAGAGTAHPGTLDAAVDFATRSFYMNHASTARRVEVRPIELR